MKETRSIFQLAVVVVLIVLISHEVGGGQDSSVADPTIGTWKLNLAKSSLVSIPAYNMVPPKEYIENYRQVEGRIQLTATTTNSDGSVTSSTFSWPAQGGAVQFQGG